MLRWPVVFFLLALSAAVFGFSGISMNAVLIAKVLLITFLLLFFASMVMPRLQR